MYIKPKRAVRNVLVVPIVVRATAVAIKNKHIIKNCLFQRPQPDKEVLVLKPYFSFILHQKSPKYDSITDFLFFV